MSVPRNPSFTELNKRVNQGIDGLQRKIGWNPQYGKDSQPEIDGLWSSIRAIEARVGRNEVTNKLEHAKLWAAIRGIENLVRGALAGLPALVKFLVLSTLSSILFSMVASIVAQLIGKADLSAVKKVAEDALSIANKALGDARAAATIAVKAEGKADRAITLAQNAINELKAITQDALRAMQRLEAFIKSEIDFLTKSTRDALFRLQGRIARLEGIITGLERKFQADLKQINANLTATINAIKADLKQINANLTATINAIKADLERKLQTFTTTINNIKTNVFNELAKLKPLVDKIPKILTDIAGLGIQIAAVTLAVSAIQAVLGRLKPMTIINNYNTTNINNTTNVVNAAPDLSLLRKIDITTRTNLGITTYIQGIVNTINLKMGGLIQNGGLAGWMMRFTQHQVLDRMINFLTLAATIHNATQLSSNIGQTLIQAMQNVFDLFGIKDSEGNTYQISELIGTSINNFITAIVGAENIEGIKKEWAKYNRIYQAAGNLFSSLLSMGDTITNALQVVTGQNARIGNALRLWGVVGERAYNWFNPNPNFSNPLLTKLNSLEETASVVEQVTQEPLNIKSAKEDLEQSAANLADSLAEKDDSPQGKEFPEAEKVKQEYEDGKEESKGKDITDTADKLEADD